MNRSGANRIDVELERLAPGLRKASPRSPSADARSPQHAEFLAAYHALIRAGWTVRAISRHLGISHRYLIDMRRAARPARTAACDWIVRMWDLLGRVDSECLPSGTGG